MLPGDHNDWNSADIEELYRSQKYSLFLFMSTAPSLIQLYACSAKRGRSVVMRSENEYVYSAKRGRSFVMVSENEYVYSA